MENYNKLIDSFINELIEEKDKISDDIAEITTFVDTRLKDNSLTQWDIDYINKKRNSMSVYYDLIDDLEYLKQRKKLQKEGEII